MNSLLSFIILIKTRKSYMKMDWKTCLACSSGRTPLVGHLRRRPSPLSLAQDAPVATEAALVPLCQVCLVAPPNQEVPEKIFSKVRVQLK